MYVDTIVHPRWIIPVEPAGVREHHSLLIHEGRVVAVEPRAQTEGVQAREVIELPRHVLIPGLVNAHTHAAMSLFRGLADDLPLQAWLKEHVWPAEAHFVAPEFVRDGTLLAIAEMLRGGTTCFNDMYFFPDETARVARETGVRACIGLVLLDFPSAWAQNADEYLSKGLKLHDDLRAHPLVTTAFAPHAPYTVSDAPLARVRTLAEELDLPIHMHVHETAHEVSEALSATGRRPLARLHALGLLSPRLLAVHMTQLDTAEIAQLAESGAHVLHCPESNLKLASGMCPVAALLEAGVNVALGTDGAASNNDLDMLAELRTAALLAKGVAGDPTVLPAPQALSIATLGGAKALGLDERIGSLAPGKEADVVALDLSGLSQQPVYDPLSQVVYTATREHVSDVWIAGRRVVYERRLTTIDANAVLRRADAWHARIAAYFANAPRAP